MALIFRRLTYSEAEEFSLYDLEGIQSEFFFSPHKILMSRISCRKRGHVRVRDGAGSLSENDVAGL